MSTEILDLIAKLSLSFEDKCILQDILSSLGGSVSSTPSKPSTGTDSSSVQWSRCPQFNRVYPDVDDSGNIILHYNTGIKVGEESCVGNCLFSILRTWFGSCTPEITLGSYKADLTLESNTLPEVKLPDSNPVPVVTESTRTQSGFTYQRPVEPSQGFMFFDLTIGKPVWYYGNSWVFADGTVAD